MERAVRNTKEDRADLPRLPDHLEWRDVDGRPRIKRKAGVKESPAHAARAASASAGRMMDAARKAMIRPGSSLN